jgi:tripartite-type tricarboxylate transporter receptor subunit TctC
MNKCLALILSLLLAAFPLLSNAQSVANYPTRTIKLVSASSPGSGGDVMARLLAAEMEKALGGTIIIENKPGAEGIIASQAVANARPDGYTLLFNYTAHVINPSLRQQPFDPIRDFTPISMVSTNWTVLVVSPDSPVRSVQDLIALARAKPKALSVGFLPGSVTHIANELMLSELNLDVLRVPYKTNADAIRDLMGGQINFAFSTIGPIQGFLQSSKLRALAMTEPKRSDLLPGVPALAETIPGFAVTGWYGLIGPRDLPPSVVGVLNKAVHRALADPALKAKFVQLGSEPSPNSAQEFSAFMASEIPRWASLVKRAKLQ